MAIYDVGEGLLQIVPSFKGVAKAIEAEAKKWGLSAGNAYADVFNDTVGKRTNNAPLGPSAPTSSKQGQQSGGAFADGFKARVTAALKSLPEAKIGVATTEAEQKIKDLRAELETLSKRTVGVDLSDEEALAQIDRIKSELSDLARSSPSASVKLDTLAAVAQLDRFRSDLDRLSTESPDVDVDVNTAGAEGHLAGLKASLSALSSTSVDVAVITDPAMNAIEKIKSALLGLSAGAVITPIIAGGASLLGPLAAVGGGIAGTIASALPGLSNIKDAFSAEGKAADDAGKSAGSSAQAQVAAANQIKAAQQSLADARRQADRQAVDDAEKVKNARQAVADAEQKADQDSIASAQAVADARAKLAEVEDASLASTMQALRDVANAQHTLDQANRSATDAQDAYNSAVEQGTRDLESYANNAADSQLSAQQAAIDLTRAQQNLDAVNASSQSTDLDKQQAVLDLAKAQQEVTEANERAAESAADNTKAQAAGVDGLQAVKSAAEQLADAQYAQTQAQQGLADAQAALAKEQLQILKNNALAIKAVSAAEAAQQLQARSSAEQVAKAQQGEADAIRARSRDEQDATLGIARAQEQLAQARTSANQATSGGATAANAYGAALAKLTPQEQALYTATQQFKTAFTGWGAALEPDVLPLFTSGLGILSGLLPKLNPLIHATAGALGEIETSIAGAAKGPGLTTFLNTLTSLVGPALKNIAGIGSNLAGVFAHVVEAFAPLSGPVLSGLKGLTSELNAATTSPGLAKFVQTIAGIGPLLNQTVGSVGGLAGKIVGALAPLSGPVLSVINTLAQALSGIVTQIGPSITGLFKTLEPAINSLIGALAPVITGVVKTLAPVLGTLATALSQGLAALAPAIQPIATLIGAIATALAPVLPLLGQLIGAILPPLASLFSAVVAALSPFISQLVDALQPVIPQIADAFGQFITALQPLFPILGQVLVALVPLIPPLAQLIVQILELATQLLPILIPLFKLLPPVIQFLTTVINFVVKALTDLVQWIGDAINWLKDFGSHASDAAHAVSNAWNTAWGSIRGAWNSVRDFLTGEWASFTKTAGKAWDGIAGAIGKAFGAVKSAVSGVWSDVETVFADGVNFVTQKILNPLIGILNDVLGVFGVKIGKIGKITVPGSSSGKGSGGNLQGKTGKYAVGGVLPGYTPGTDGIAIPQYHFSGGEGVLVPEAVRALGGAIGIQEINSRFTARVSAPNHFSGGGTLPPPFTLGGGIGFGGTVDFGGLGGVIDKIKDAIRRGAADVAIAGLKTAESPIKALLSTAPSSFAHTLSTGVFNKLNSAVYDYIRGHVKTPTASNNGGGPIPTGQHLALIQQALGLAGVPDTGPNEASVNTIVTYESGWNPDAINLTDSNAAAGHPSQGLMQTIPGTFEAYRLHSLPDVITDPIANLVAGIRYAVSRYGSLEGVPGVEAVAHGGSYVGYDNGGYLPPGFTTVFNGTGRPEPVFTAEQFEGMSSGQDMTGVRSDLAALRTTVAELGDVFGDAITEQGRQIARMSRGGLRP